MEEVDLELDYKPRYPEVHEVLERTRFVVLVAHRRFGKTVMVVNHLLKMATLCTKPRGVFGYVAPFRDQAKKAAWEYLKHYSSPIPFCSVNESELRITLPSIGGGAEVRIFGANNPDALRGLYFDGIVLDEVADMKPQVWEEIIRPALSDRRGWAVFIGTPKGVNIFSELYYGAIEKRKKGNLDWDSMSYPITRTGERSLPAEEVAAAKEDMSENSFRQEYLCDFAASSDNILITLDDVRQAMSRAPDFVGAEAWPLVIGVDVARFGDDATVFFRRRGHIAFMPDVLRKLSNVEVAHRLMAYIAEYKPAYVCIDQGQGTGVIDLITELTRHQRGVSIVEVPFGGRATDPDRFANRRAEMWVAIRDWLRGGGRLPDDSALAAELTAPTYFFNAAGKIQLEAKEKVKERLARSTDLADALALTFAVPVQPDEEIVTRQFARYGAEGRDAAARHIMGRREPYNIFGGDGGRSVWD